MVRERGGLGLGVGLLVIGAAVWLTWPLAVAARRGRTIGTRRHRAVQRPRASSARVLIVGDAPTTDAATAARIGVGGQLAEAHPDWTIGDLTPPGSRTTDVARVLGRLSERLDRRGLGAVYDAVVIQAGGADAVRFTREGPLSVSLAVALAAAGRVARHTLLVTGRHRASAEYPRRVSWLLGWRGRRIRALFQAIACEAGVGYVDLHHGAEAVDAALVSRLSGGGMAPDRRLA